MNRCGMVIDSFVFRFCIHVCAYGMVFDLVFSVCLFHLVRKMCVFRQLLIYVWLVDCLFVCLLVHNENQERNARHTHVVIIVIILKMTFSIEVKTKGTEYEYSNAHTHIDLCVRVEAIAADGWFDRRVFQVVYHFVGA